jgi:hypothetical protein
MACLSDEVRYSTSKHIWAARIRREPCLGVVDIGTYATSMVPWSVGANSCLRQTWICNIPLSSRSPYFLILSVLHLNSMYPRKDVAIAASKVTDAHTYKSMPMPKPRLEPVRRLSICLLDVNRTKGKHMCAIKQIVPTLLLQRSGEI